MVGEVAEKKLGLVGVSHARWKLFELDTGSAAGDFAKEVFHQADSAGGVIALEGPCPSLIGRKPFSESGQGKDWLLKRCIEQGIADELRRTLAVADVFAVVLVQAVSQGQQPPDLTGEF